MPTIATTPAEPTAERERLDILDACRGFALGGIFLINLAVFTGFVFMPREVAAALPTARFDLPALGLTLWLGYGKFYSLFSLLFGIGFALQLAAAERRSDDRLRIFRRRLTVLALIGAVHLYFWEGDILVLYALVGFFLIPFRRASSRTLLRTAVALVLAPVALQILITMSGGAADPGAPLLAAGDAVLVATGFQAGASPYPILRDAGWIEYLRFQLSGVFFRYADLLSSGRPFKVLAMFLVGAWVGRTGMLRELDGWIPTLRRVRAWGLGLGLPAALAHAGFMATGDASTSWLKVAESLAYALGVAPLALGYASSFALLWCNPIWRRRLERLAPAGRMALTNYLMQTTIAIALFYGIGLGLMGRVGAIWWVPLTIVTLAVQSAISRWWLARFSFGPAEWIWRQVTYKRRLPLRRRIWQEN